MLSYNEKGYVYWKGERVPRTTEVCAILAPRTWNVGEYSLNKGRIIHLITQYDDQGVLDENSIDPALMGYSEAYRKMKADTGFKVLETELKFYSKRYGYSGRADKYGELFSYLSVLDIKSGAPHEADQYQAPAYLFGLKDNGFPCWRAWDLYLKENGSYRLEEIKSPTVLFMKFLEGLKKWKEKNNVNGS